MKLKSIANIASVAALAAILPLGLSSARAVSSGTVPLAADTVIQPSQFQRVEWTEERRGQLRRAFWLIEHADGDYAGHRIKAIAHIKRAGEILGLDLHGKGYGTDVRQTKSDDRLREARRLIQEIAKESGEKEREPLHKAVAEINESLAIH